MITFNGINIAGRNVVIRDNNIKVDGKQLDIPVGDLPTLKVEGDLVTLDTDLSVEMNGNVTGNVDAGNSVKCNDVSGNVDAGNSVNCGDIGGNVDAGNIVNAKTVQGSISL
jgi:hypothetical protein